MPAYQKPPEGLREFHDMDTTRGWLYENTTKALSSRFPLETPSHRLELHDVRVEPKDYDWQQQKDALLSSRQLHVPVRGTWRLVDKASGALVDERKDDTVMRLPYVTDRGTILHNGTAYSAINQSRLRPGVYTRVKRSGEPEAMFNPRPGSGRGFRLWMQPENGILRMQVAQSNIPLYSVLNAVGVGDDDMRKAWGDELFEANKAWHEPKAAEKLYARFSGPKADPSTADDAARGRAVLDMLNKSELDDTVVSRTLGLQGVKNASPSVLLRAAQKLVNIQRGQEDPDDRDHPRFSKILSIEDHIPERVAMDAGRLARTLAWRVSRDKSLRRLPTGALSQHVSDFILGSRLAQPGEETNPLSLLEQMSRITKLGEGGIGSADAVTDEARNVNGGQYGFIDLVNGPEGQAIGIDVRAAFRTFKGRDNNLYAEFKDARTGKEVFLRPDDVDGKIVAFPGELARKRPVVAAIVNGKIDEVPREDADYEIPSMAHMNSSHSNMNPMPTGMQAARAFYGAKFWSQYMPVTHGEVPLVESLTPDGESTFGEMYGNILGSIPSKAGGVVEKVDDTAVVIRGQDGKRVTTNLVKNFPFNGYSGISFSPSVSVGQEVKPGDRIAHSNFTDAKTGGIKLGTNLKVAIIPERGKSFEDAYVISESAAKKLSTDRLFGFDQERERGVTISRNRYSSLFPKNFTSAQLETIGDDGIVLPGTVLKKGDPIVLATGPKLLGPADVQLGRLHKALRNAHTDKATRWDKDYDGVVVDALQVKGGARVNVMAKVPVGPGDKLATRYGLKGVVGRIIPDEEMLQDPVTNQPYDIAMNPMGVLSRVAPAQVAEVMIAKVAKATGKQMRLPQYPPEEGWEAWGRAQLAAAGLSEVDEVFDPKTGRKLDNPISTGYAYVLPFHHLADEKLSTRGGEQVGYTCYDSETEVLTDVGWVAWPAVVAGQKLAAVDLADKSFSFETPSRLVVADYSGPMYRLSAKYVDWMVTPNHGVVHTYDERSAVFVTRRADKLRSKFNVPVGGCRLKSKRSKRVVVIPPWRVSKGRVYGGATIPVAEYAELLGWYLSEGHVALNTADRHYATIISQSAAANPDKFKRIGALLRRCGFSPFVHVDVHGAEMGWVTKGRYLAEHFAKFGRTSQTKVMPACVADFPIAAKQRLLEALLLGDGNTTVTPGSMRRIAVYNTSSKALSDGVQLLCLGMGLWASVHIDAPRITSFGPTGVMYRVGISWDRETTSVGQVPATRQRVVDYTGRVYCATVSTGVLIVRRNGLVVFSGNSDEQPAKGGDEMQQAKRMSGQDVNALLAYGATDVLRDSHVIRGSRNDEYFRALRLGRPLPEPKVPFIYNKMMETLKAGGINLRQKGDITELLPMTDKDVDALSDGELSSGGTVDANLKPQDGGLFDVGKTGGIGGKKWTHIRLPEPVPNPVFEEPIRRILGLTQRELEDIITWKTPLNGKYGGEALREALAAVNPDTEIPRLRDVAMRRRGATRDAAIKALGYLNTVKRQSTNPSDWMVSRVPVIPPVFRPVSRMGDVMLSADMNELYRDVFESAKSIKELRKELPDSELANERLTMYRAVSAAFGMGDPITPEGQARRLKGAIRSLIGDSPKTGVIQAKVLAKGVDLVGRGVVTPDPNLDMDSIGIPEDSAWGLYKDFVLRSLTRRGLPVDDALRQWTERSPIATEALDKEMAVRPVLLNRAPVWHKANIIAMRPHRVKGSVIRVPPLVTKSMTMDFDGDQSNFHVPVDEKAVRQAYDLMLPSKNLFSLTDLRSAQYTPQQEMMLGIWQASRSPNASANTRVFANVAEARRAYARGELKLNDPIEIAKP